VDAAPYFDDNDMAQQVSLENSVARYLIPKERLYTGTSYFFLVSEHSDVPISFFWDTYAPGVGPRLHKHPYQEVFIVEEGKATFSLGDAKILVDGGHVVIVPKNTPHKIINSGNGMLRLIAIHCSAEKITEYLE
jgi:mannose-6-phosphate isomerase-like protein (cupin superfamily)